MNNTTSHQGRLKSLRAAGIGNALEWFDWTLYATFSVYLASNLFDKIDARSAMLATLAVFAVGFVARPIGGWLFGRLSDRLGRRAIMVITMLLLAISSLGIAIIPSYESIGLYASVALLFFRLMQGLAHGGETGVSYTYVAEIAPSKHRGLWSSSVYVGVTLGVMAATAMAAVLTWLLGAQAMADYGWRIGFAIGGLLGIYALFLRRSAQESHVFVEQQGQARPPRKLSRGRCCEWRATSSCLQRLPMSPTTRGSPSVLRRPLPGAWTPRVLMWPVSSRKSFVCAGCQSAECCPIVSAAGPWSSPGAWA